MWRALTECKAVFLLANQSVGNFKCCRLVGESSFSIFHHLDMRAKNINPILYRGFRVTVQHNKCRNRGYQKIRSRFALLGCGNQSWLPARDITLLLQIVVNILVIFLPRKRMNSASQFDFWLCSASRHG